MAMSSKLCCVGLFLFVQRETPLDHPLACGGLSSFGGMFRGFLPAHHFTPVRSIVQGRHLPNVLKYATSLDIVRSSNPSIQRVCRQI
jgi:hypothetical protein